MTDPKLTKQTIHAAIKSFVELLLHDVGVLPLAQSTIYPGGGCGNSISLLGGTDESLALHTCNVTWICTS